MRTCLSVGRVLSRPWIDASGNVALLFGLGAPVLIGVAGLAIDSAYFYDQQARMQSAADATALAVAKELHLYGDDLDNLRAVGEARAEALLAEVGIAARPHHTDIEIEPVENLISVEVTMAANAFLPVEIWGDNPIVVTSQARAFGQSKLCVIGLNGSSSETVLAEAASTITADGCAVQVNSNSPSGLVAKSGSTLTSVFTCTVGGYEASSGGTLAPNPETDCPALEDPLSSREPPPIGGCDYDDLIIDAGTQTISPGVYCGGLTIENNADVWAAPGVYVITGGKLVVRNSGKLAGDHVSFYFADDPAVLEIVDAANIRLTAPRDGAMAGMLFMEAEAAAPDRVFTVSSPLADVLLGTIYLPKGTLSVATTGSVGEESTFTIVVADRILVSHADLVINSNYGGTDIPVPDGVGPKSTMVRLEQ